MRRAFLAYLVGLVGVGLFARAGILLTATYVVAGAYLMSRAWMRRAIPRLEVQRRFTDRAFPGDEVEVVLTVANPARLPVPWVELYERLPTALAMPPSHRAVMSLAGGEERRTTYTLRPTRRGYHLLGPLSARAGDLLGVADEEVRAIGAQPLVVYPTVVPLDRLGLPNRSPFAAVPDPTPLFTDPARVGGVRPYQPGDPQRTVHWPATARTGTLLTKQFDPTAARDTVVCLDLDRRGYPKGRRITSVEAAITVAASIVHHVTTVEKQPAALLTEAHDPLAGGVARIRTPVGVRRGHLALVLEVLARVQPARATPIGRLVHETVADLPWGSTLVVVTGQSGTPTLDALFRLRRSGFLVVLVLVGEDDPSAERRAAALGLQTHRVRDARELAGVGR